MAIAINFFQPLGHISPEAALISFGAYMVLFVPFAILFWLRYKLPKPFFIIKTLPFFFWWWGQSRQKEPLKSRSAFLVLFQLSFMSIVYFCYALSTYFYFAPTPDYGYACQLMYWVSSGFVPLGVFVPFALCFGASVLTDQSIAPSPMSCEACVCTSSTCAAT